MSFSVIFHLCVYVCMYVECIEIRSLPEHGTYQFARLADQRGPGLSCFCIPSSGIIDVSYGAELFTQLLGT